MLQNRILAELRTYTSLPVRVKLLTPLVMKVPCCITMDLKAMDLKDIMSEGFDGLMIASLWLKVLCCWATWHAGCQFAQLC